MANACSACSYRLVNEPKLKFSMLLTCDGNDSLKRVANASIVDRRTLDHGYFLSSDYVDQFANEVPRKSTNDTGVNVLSSCEQRWKNARADDYDKKIVVFDETGVFAVSCRHGFVLLLEDMRQSGELAKYPLAAVNKLCEVFGDDLLIGYDIGCTFGGTAERSLKIGPVVRKHNTQFIVGSFHGYAHNRKCQLKNHPLNVVGAGLESFEENETLFSSTNTVARTTRHATPFHRRQLIVLHVSGWDFDRRCSLGKTLKTRYNNALKISGTLPQELLKLDPTKNDEDWHSLFEQECKYFDSLSKPSEESDFGMRYVKCLQHIDMYRDHPTVKDTPTEHQYQRKIETQTRKLEAKRRSAAEQLSAIQAEVAQMEQEHAINPRWTPECDEWKVAVQREASEGYYQALRRLELLVVQRLGYKARKQITKALYRREKAIHTALNEYNNAACRIDPPRPQIDFKELSEYAYLADFDLLKFSEHGVRDAAWSQPTNRRGIQLWQKIQRAQEEIVRLNVEISRVRTHIRDEEDYISTQYTILRSTNPTLASILLTRMNMMKQVNQRINNDLASIAKLKGFSGSLDFGIRAGSEAPQMEGMETPDVDVLGSFEGISLNSPQPQEINTPGYHSEDEDEGELLDEAQGELIAMEKLCQTCQTQ
ncbi:hypothetical protein RSOL_504150 [Rhizoctonia solani AG-3 Rhs1AP]|uniref:Uncharacterized protein n=2 Tax=Rhizoctonia solani AG-3 TaxID=1086053 RepID=X8JQC2_9AGAM|nr:hypothetical protein RSOL_504150 [Rhizoctonia solani AG-3 Rhs1AP]